MVKLKNAPSPELAKARAERIKGLRKALRLSGAKLCEKYSKYGLTESALSGWENIRWHGLTENGANILSKAFQDEGLNVTVEWLLFGVGDSPISDSFQFHPKNIELSEQGLIADELQLFHQHHANSIDMIVADDGLAPWIAPGDCVAGIRYFGNDMEKAIGHPSIVQTESGTLLVRMVSAGKELEFYTLTCTNPKTTAEQPSLKDIKLLSAAPVLWVRKLG